jgi:hypothetical protein
MPMSASRQIHTCASPTSISMTGTADVSAFGALAGARSAATPHSIIAGTKGGELSAAFRRASRRQVNSCCGVAPCRRATCETTASGASDSSIARAFSSSDQRRRPQAPVITSMRRAASSFGASVRSSLDTSRSPNQEITLADPSSKLKVGAEHRLRLGSYRSISIAFGITPPSHATV